MRFSSASSQSATLQQLHPDQAADHGAAEQQHQHSSTRGCWRTPVCRCCAERVIPAAVLASDGATPRGALRSAARSVTSRQGHLAVLHRCRSSTETDTGITGLPRPGLTASSCSRTSRATGSPSWRRSAMVSRPRRKRLNNLAGTPCRARSSTASPQAGRPASAADATGRAGCRGWNQRPWGQINEPQSVPKEAPMSDMRNGPLRGTSPSTH